MNLKDLIRSVSLGGAFAVALTSCSVPMPQSAGGVPQSPPVSSEALLAKDLQIAPNEQGIPNVERPGIATGWGREVSSSMTYTNFTRASSKPKYVSTIRYNDIGGAKAMGVNRKMSGRGMQKAAGGLVEWGMSGGWGMLDNYWWRGERFVMGKKGREYQLKIKNTSHVRLEVVLSVDGLDVIDGESASTKKRGYIIGPGRTLSVKGFRTSEKRVATFKFSSVGASYANQRHGDTRNIGVVGLALYTEKGREPGLEAQVREGARPFAEAPSIRARD